jgi:hypothetical protein
LVDEAGGKISPEANVVPTPDTDAHQREVGKFCGYAALSPVRLASTRLAHGLGEAEIDLSRLLDGPELSDVSLDGVREKSPSC